VFFCGEDGAITVQEQDPKDADLRLGQRLGGYVVVARVADGAMGRVYEGRHAENKSRVAVKVLHPQVARDTVSVERFKREYETANEMDHQYVVKVLEFGNTSDGSRFLTMEYLEGEELGKVLGRGSPVPPERIVRVTCQIALALEYAHSFGFIHRDLKPDNIFLCKTEDGDDVRILDFGSVKLQMEMGAKLTAFGTTVGSPYYMSPEQAMGKADVDQRTDVFALAAIVYEMLTAKVAFEAPSLARILVRIMQDEPTPPSKMVPGTPAALDNVIVRGLRKEKTERYGGAREIADAVIAAYGLEGTAEHFAKAADAEIVKALEEAKTRPAAKKAEAPPSTSTGEVAGAAKATEDVAPAKAARGGEKKPSKMKATMVGAGAVEIPKPKPAAPSTASSAGRATMPTGARGSTSLPPLPTTGPSGKTIAIIAIGVVVACGLLALMLR
jgi:serine/threonine-protein kinase